MSQNAHQVAAVLKEIMAGVRPDKIVEAMRLMGEALDEQGFNMSETLVATAMFLGHITAANPVVSPLPLLAALDVAKLAEQGCRQLGGGVVSVGPEPRGTLQ